MGKTKDRVLPSGSDYGKLYAGVVVLSDAMDFIKSYKYLSGFDASTILAKRFDLDKEYCLQLIMEYRTR